MYLHADLLIKLYLLFLVIHICERYIHFFFIGQNRNVHVVIDVGLNQVHVPFTSLFELSGRICHNVIISIPVYFSAAFTVVLYHTAL